tara:strand:+ start:329 stop:553 length:225 start_codon:yes stop_codon:yes gene_type:complete
LDVFEERNGMISFYTLLYVTQDERENFIKYHHLSFGPLKSEGYFSLGCKGCKVLGKGREGRWNNSLRTECGLYS